MSLSRMGMTTSSRVAGHPGRSGARCAGAQGAPGCTVRRRARCASGRRWRRAYVHNSARIAAVGPSGLRRTAFAGVVVASSEVVCAARQQSLPDTALLPVLVVPTGSGHRVIARNPPVGGEMSRCAASLHGKPHIVTPRCASPAGAAGAATGAGAADASPAGAATGADAARGADADAGRRRATARARRPRGGPRGGRERSRPARGPRHGSWRGSRPRRS